MDFQRKLIETIDSADVFKKLKQRDQKKMFGLNRQMAETDKAMEKARGKNWYILRLITEKQKRIKANKER